MKTTYRVSVAILGLMLMMSASAVFAQQAKTEKEAGCPHMTAAKASLDQLENTLAAGNQTSDPAQMKASLEKAQTELAAARKEMSMCPMMNGGMMHHHDMDDEMAPGSQDKK